jgi:hypothetical protein
MKQTTVKRLLALCLLVGLVALSIVVYSENVNHRRHPNLAAAQEHIEKAINKISAAQVANEFDMEGHAAKAKSLLDQAYVEIKLAALAANK